MVSVDTSRFGCFFCLAKLFLQTEIYFAKSREGRIIWPWTQNRPQNILVSVSSNANSCQRVSVCLKSSSKTCPLYYQTSSLQLCSPFSHTYRDNIKILPPLCKCKVQKCPPKKQNQLGITLRNHTTFYLTFTPHIIFLTKSLPPNMFLRNTNQVEHNIFSLPNYGTSPLGGSQEMVLKDGSN